MRTSLGSRSRDTAKPFPRSAGCRSIARLHQTGQARIPSGHIKYPPLCQKMQAVVSSLFSKRKRLRASPQEARPNSLLAKRNSLLLIKIVEKIPARRRRELSPKLTRYQRPSRPVFARNAQILEKFPANSLLAGNSTSQTGLGRLRPPPRI